MSFSTLPLILFVFVSYTQFFELDRSRSRTSSAIKSGDLSIRVDDDYKTVIKGSVKLLFGKRDWKHIFHLPRDYFTDSFWDELEAVGYRDLPDGRLEYVRRVSYQCHEVQINEDESKVVLEICRNYRGIGARKIDVSGVDNGIKYKVGFDLKR